MAANAIVDAGYLIALLYRRDRHHAWAAAQAEQHPPPWKICDAAVSETFYVLGESGMGLLPTLFRRHMLFSDFDFAQNSEAVLALMEKYKEVPMSFADACLVRMTEVFNNAIVLTTDTDFRIYRRHGRQVVPCILPA